MVIGPDCIGSCKSNYHTITTTKAPMCVSIPVGAGSLNLQERFEDIKWIIKSRKENNDRQFNGQHTKDKEISNRMTGSSTANIQKTNNDL